MSISWFRALALLDPPQKRRMYLWIVVTSINSIFVAAGVVSVMPFVALLSSPGLIESNKIINAIFTHFSFESYNAFIAAFGVFTISVFLLSNTFAIFETFVGFRFANDLEYDFSRRLFSKYVHQDYEFFLNHKRSDLARRLTQEVERGVIGTIATGIEVYAATLLVLIMVLLLMLVDPAVTITTAAVLLSAYLAIDRLVHRRVKQLGREFLSLSDRVFSTTLEMLSGIKEVKIYGAEDRFIDEFAHFYRLLTQRSTHYNTLNLIPRQALEMVAYGGIIIFSIFVVTFHSDPTKVFPLIAMFGLSAYRLIPALRTTFAGLEKLKYSETSLEVVSADIQMRDAAYTRPANPSCSFELFQSISGRSISFSYDHGRVPVIRNLSFTIPAGKSTVLMGPSGVGKSTLVDLVVGLLIPQSGEFLVDGHALDRDDASAWQAMIGYVPQKVYLFDDTIARNIAVSEMSHAVDLDRVEQVSRLARLHNFVVNELDNGYETRVGPGTKELSGGQLKRLGIARALYRAPKVIVLDEATAELDSVIEAEILAEILSMEDLTKIFVTHDEALALRCEHVVVFDRQGCVAEGAPQLLLGSQHHGV